jgi:hypothetical protein
VRFGAGRARAARKIAGSLKNREQTMMDVEHINAIGNALADLTKRTQDLRGYL